MMDNGLDVPFQVRDLAAMSLDNIEKAFAQFFDAATRSIAPNSAEIIALLERVISVKIDYARKLVLAKDLTEAAITKAAVEAVVLLKFIAIFSICILLEALLLDSAQWPFSHFLWPRPACCRARISWFL